MKKYNIVIGNVGTIEEDDKKAALVIFHNYIKMSKDSTGRVSGKPVTIFEDQDILDEYIPDRIPNQQESDTILFDIMHEIKGSALLTITGIYEIVSEEFNNEILRRFQMKNGDDNPPNGSIKIKYLTYCFPESDALKDSTKLNTLVLKCPIYNETTFNDIIGTITEEYADHAGSEWPDLTEGEVESALEINVPLDTFFDIESPSWQTGQTPRYVWFKMEYTKSK